MNFGGSGKVQGIRAEQEVRGLGSRALHHGKLEKSWARCLLLRFIPLQVNPNVQDP